MGKGVVARTSQTHPGIPLFLNMTNADCLALMMGDEGTFYSLFLYDLCPFPFGSFLN